MSGRFVVVDLSTMLVVGEIEDPVFAGNCVLEVHPSGDYVGVASSADGGTVVAVDVRDKTVPAILDTLVDGDLGEPTAIMISSTAIFVASNSATAITSVQHTPLPLSKINALVYSAFVGVPDMHDMGNGYGLAACPFTSSVVFGTELVVTDDLVSAPHFTGVVAVSSQPGGGIAYAVATGSERLTTIDAFDVYNTAVIGYLDSTYFANATSMSVSGNFIFVATSTGELVVVDVSDPRTPTLVTVYENAAELGSPISVEVEGDDVYVLDSAGALIKLNFSSPDLVSYGEYPFPYNSSYDVDSRVTLTATGPITVLALTYVVDDTDNPAPSG